MIKRLMSYCTMLPHLDGVENLFDRLNEKNVDFNIENLKIELIDKIKQVDFDWVKLGLETSLIYTSDAINSEKFDVDDLLIFTDSFNWKDIVQEDAFLSFDQRDELKGQFRDIGIQNFKNINELMDNEQFKWLPFEVKHNYKSNFGQITYNNEDVIYYLKNIVWEYLFPNSLNSEKLDSLRKECMPFLEEKQKNDGWVEMAVIVKSLISFYPELDLYMLNKVNWDKNIQHIKHCRNPITLGFKRIRPLVQI